MDWLDLLAVQGTLKSLLQHHSSKASILWFSALFTVQLSHPYMTAGKTIALTRRTFVGKVCSLHCISLLMLYTEWVWTNAWHVSIVMVSYRLYLIEYFHCFKNLLFYPFSITQALASIDLFTVSIVLPFPECHIDGIIEEKDFSGWHLALSNMHLRFLPIIS